MSEGEGTNMKPGNGQGRAWLNAGLLVLGMNVLSVACWAATPSGAVPGPVLPPTLANVVLLSDAAMAKQSGTGLRPPVITHEAIGTPPVLLWDELRTTPQVPPAVNGLTIGGAK